MDNSILKELFGNYLKACEILGITELTDKVKAALEKLPPFKRGKGGQLQEWFLDYPEVDVHLSLIHIWILVHHRSKRFLKLFSRTLYREYFLDLCLHLPCLWMIL